MQIEAITTTATQAGTFQSVANGMTGVALPAAGSKEFAPFSDLFSNAVGQIDTLENR